jgi:hypothetical protein
MTWSEFVLVLELLYSSPRVRHDTLECLYLVPRDPLDDLLTPLFVLIRMRNYTAYKYYHAISALHLKICL